MKNTQNLSLALIMALRSLLAHKTKSFIVGALLTLGTFLVTCGIALLDNVEQSISKSVIESLAGHLQIYSANAKDKLAIYGDGSGGMPDIGAMDSFQELLGQLSDFPQIEAVIPMGVKLASMNRGNILERQLSDWRRSMDDESMAVRALRIKQTQGRITAIKSDLSKQYELADQHRRTELAKVLAAIEFTEKPEFWTQAQTQPSPALEWIDTQIAPFIGDGRVIFLRFVGTDFEAFHKNFRRFKLVAGTLVPEGERGMLINQTFADARLKLLPARLLDKLAESAKEKVLLTDSADLRAKAKRLTTQVKSVVRLIEPNAIEEIFLNLRRAMPDCSAEFDALIQCLLTVDDVNVLEHHRLFYEIVAPHIELYPFEIGKPMTLKSFTKSGFPKATNIKVYGTYYFEGLENSMLSGAANLVDLETFRTLYGVRTTAQHEELLKMKEASGAKEVDRDNAEALLFGAQPADAFPTTVPDSSANPGSVNEVTDLVQNAAVFLNDPRQIGATKDKLNQFFKEHALPYQAIDWREASGLIGQLATLVRGILIVALMIIFGVTVIIINNAMIMATLERVREIGTMRAIGAQRRFIIHLVMFESLCLAWMASLLGIIASSLLFAYLESHGIPATNDIARFFFSGPRLYPVLEIPHVLAGIFTVVLVGLLATYYPVRIAIRVDPVEAMSGGE